MAAQSKAVSGKIIGVWGPIFIFAFLGFDHVVANMFNVPLAIWHQTPGLSVGLYIWKGRSFLQMFPIFLLDLCSCTGLIPATLGNLVGGAGFAGLYLWWFYIVDQPQLRIDGTEYESDHHRVHP
jgi:formate/nitrite transporter FocA (FNT family)